MEEARNYIDTLRKSVNAWDYWVHNGNTIISDAGVESYLHVIKSDTDALSNLDAKKVKDEILERKDGISFRIERIEEYGLLPLLQYLEDFKNTKVILDDEAVSNAINTYFLRIYEKANDLCRVMAEAEKFLYKDDPILKAAYNDRILLAIFGAKEELREYILYCKQAKTGSEMARRAAELYVQDKIKYKDLNCVLHGRLKGIGLDVGEYGAWKTETRKTRLRLGK